MFKYISYIIKTTAILTVEFFSVIILIMIVWKFDIYVNNDYLTVLLLQGQRRSHIFISNQCNIHFALIKELFSFLRML